MTEESLFQFWWLSRDSTGPILFAAVLSPTCPAFCRTNFPTRQSFFTWPAASPGSFAAIGAGFPRFSLRGLQTFYCIVISGPSVPCHQILSAFQPNVSRARCFGSQESGHALIFQSCAISSPANPARGRIK